MEMPFMIDSLVPLETIKTLCSVQLPLYNSSSKEEELQLLLDIRRYFCLLTCFNALIFLPVLFT